MPTSHYGGLSHYRTTRGKGLNKAVVPPKSRAVKAVPTLRQPKKAPVPKKGPRSGKAKCVKCTR